jgi:hypothetical protein
VWVEDGEGPPPNQQAVVKIATNWDVRKRNHGLREPIMGI